MFKTLAASALATVASAMGDAMIGTNIGGWMVLEPWITPSLFYRFLDQTGPDNVGMDIYTFCTVLGADYGNQVLREHWSTWVTEDLIADLAAREVEIIRVPIGDWTLRQYGPYVGCTDGATDYIDWLMDTAATYGIKVLLDVHAMKDSQNGYDNSGLSAITEWTDENNFVHWSHAFGNWMGTWNDNDGNGGYYEDYNIDNINWAITNVALIMQRWGNHEAMYALEPLNEPWWSSDLSVLKYFYKAAREEVRKYNNETLFVFHDAFHSDGDTWNDLFSDYDMDNVVMDTHQYMAWWEGRTDIGSYCDDYGTSIANVASSVKYPIWVGEWALATDVCAMWLGGFNDGNTVPQYDCKYVECPYSYFSNSTLAVDFDRTKAINGPFGEMNYTNPMNGTCTTDSDFYSEDDVATLGSCVSYIFDNNNINGTFLWTARNELEDKWNYVNAYDKGWLKTRNSTTEFLN